MYINLYLHIRYASRHFCCSLSSCYLWYKKLCKYNMYENNCQKRTFTERNIFKTWKGKTLIAPSSYFEIILKPTLFYHISIILFLKISILYKIWLHKLFCLSRNESKLPKCTHYESRRLSFKSVRFGFLESFLDEQNNLYSQWL